MLEFGVVQFQAVELEQQDVHGYFKAHIWGGCWVLEKSFGYIHGYEIFFTSLIQNEACCAETPNWI